VSIKNIRSALEQRLATLSPATPVAWENAQYAPTLGTMYLAVALLPARTENPTITGDPAQELALEQGVFQVTVVAPVNGGSGPASDKAEAIRALFPRGLSLTVSGTTVRIAEKATVSAAIPNDDWYNVPVSIPYFCHTL
jgi:Bacteriophage related domain of unknown function